MTYDSMIYNAIQAEWLRVCGDDVRAQPGWSKVVAAFDAIPPLTLKTEDGRLALTELVGYTDSERIFSQRRAGTYAIYRIVEDPAQ